MEVGKRSEFIDCLSGEFEKPAKEARDYCAAKNGRDYGAVLRELVEKTDLDRAKLEYFWKKE